MTTDLNQFDSAPDASSALQDKMPLARDDSVLAEKAPEAQQPSDRRRLPGWLRGITTTVVILGIISLLTDMSSEMIIPLRLIFLVQVLGTPLTLAGLIEGVAEGATSILKVVSGRLADRFPDRRQLVIGGYTVSNLAKPLLALVTQWPIALGLVLIERTGKAVRGSPRDAMIADAVEPEVRGKAFGFHRSFDTLGAAIGPLIAILLLTLNGDNLRSVFAWTIVPGLFCIFFCVFYLRDPRASADARRHENKAAVVATSQSAMKAWRGFGPRFWLFTAAATCFALGNSSDAFLFLRTEGIEASLIAVPLVYFAFNMIYALLATPLGSLSDRFGRLPLLALGYAAFTLVYLGWTHASANWHVWLLFGVYGVYYAATEGVAKAFVTDLVPKTRRGSAMGWYNGLTGMAALPANVLAAWLWSQFGPGAAFGLGAWLGAVALGLLCAWWPWLRANNPAPWHSNRSTEQERDAPP
ncbi:MAG TPA: MFS transporter [Ktedonobacterales bacterium]|nr:MFS transporter [Ktedonobacterales bacterium]